MDDNEYGFRLGVNIFFIIREEAMIRREAV